MFCNEYNMSFIRIISTFVKQIASIETGVTLKTIQFRVFPRRQYLVHMKHFIFFWPQMIPNKRGTMISCYYSKEEGDGHARSPESQL